MLQAVRDFHRIAGLARGVKAAGGIRMTKDASGCWCWSTRPRAGLDDPGRFRFGASSLLDDLLMQPQKQATGRYWSSDSIPVA